MDTNNDFYTHPLQPTAQFFFCGMPFRLDTYSGCSHNCWYCFARASESFQSVRKAKGKILPGRVSDLQRLFSKALDGSGESADIVVEWLRHKMPIHWGGMSDPFQPLEASLGISKQTMRILNKYRYPAIISTKGAPLLASHIDILRDGLYGVQVSLITTDNPLLAKLEPAAPSANARLDALELLARNGIWTACRIQPLIPSSPIEDGISKTLVALRDVGVKHVIVEYYKIPITLPKVNRRTLDDVCGGKVELEYKVTRGVHSGQEIVLPAWRIWHKLEEIIHQIHELGMTYGAADNQFRDLGDTQCCCGIDNLEGFENYWHYQTGNMAKIAHTKGFVTQDDCQHFWTGHKKLKFQDSWLTDIGGHQGSFPPSQIVDKVWALKDSRSLQHLVNMEQIYTNGKIAYKYIDGCSKLAGKRCRQVVMDIA